MTYQPLFNYFASRAGMGSFQVCVDEYVTAEDGTCIVHQAPAFGEDDFRVCMAHGVIVKGESIPCPLDASAKFTAEAGDYKGLYIKDADEAIMAELKSRDRLAQKGNINHRYPYCWRSDTPLIYRIVPSWFIEGKFEREKKEKRKEKKETKQFVILTKTFPSLFHAMSSDKNQR